MSVDAWTALWVVLLWGSSGAFLLVTFYILGGALMRIFGKQNGAGND